MSTVVAQQADHMVPMTYYFDAGKEKMAKCGWREAGERARTGGVH